MNKNCLSVLLGSFLLYGSLALAPAHADNCNCYFSLDCGGKMFCKLNDSDKRKEETSGNLCFNINKHKKENDVFLCPNSHNRNPNTPGPCDGVCMAETKGTDAGCENPALVAQALTLWSQAFIQPALAGGGPADPTLVNQALSLPFLSVNGKREVAHAVLDAIILSLGDDFVTHLPTDPHFEEDHVIADISADSCRQASASLTTQALLAEFQVPGTAAALINQIPTSCPTLPFAAPCTGPDALSCATNDIETNASALRTCAVCDVNRDGKIDITDINAIFAARNTVALPIDPRDADHDGIITVNDARLCTLMCTNPNCAP